MTNYFKVFFDEDGVFGVAYTAKKAGLFLLPERGEVHDWQPLSLELREGEFADYLASNLGCRLCSQRLADVLQSHSSPFDELQWLTVHVRSGAEERLYSILHFPDPPDVLDRERSIFVDDFVVKPVLSQMKIDNHRVFSYPGAGELPLFVDDNVKRAVKASCCTGLKFSLAPIC